MKALNNIAVVGVSGYTGLELAKILLRHPEARSLTFYMRETQGARCLTELFPQLRGSGQAPVRTLSVDAIGESGAGTHFWPRRTKCRLKSLRSFCMPAFALSI